MQYSAKDQKWDVKQTSPGAGTTLSIPGSNIADRLVYSDVWGCSGIRPEHSTDQFSGDYTKNYCAGVAVAEVPLDDLKKELDEMIENYHQSLQKNRETHEQKWYDAPQERRRYFYLTQDVLHGLDFPGPGTRVKHKFDNLILRHTAGEKTLAALDAAVGVVGSMLTSAISDGVGAGTKALFPKVGVMDAVKDLFMNKPGEDFARYVSKQGINKSSSLGSEGAKALLGLGISLGGGKAESKRTENMITAAHRLNFRKERIAVAAQLTGRHDQDAEQMSLKYAAKQSEDLFFKISRHVHWAFVLLQGKLVPMMGKLENNSGEVGYGLKGCNDCAKHLKTLYEYQHQVDKAERYLVASLALVKHLFDFEGYLSTVEKEIREILDESAGGWIANGNHEKCRKFKLVGHRYCYGPGEKVASKPYRPLRQRDKSDKPARPSKEGRKPIGQLRKQPPEEE